jgi:cyclopropane fatty-acyl-phospholipid synthase-like methyltransferase
MDRAMESNDPIELLFGGMDKLGPGSDADTLQVLRVLPQGARSVVVDAGCGAGRQTLTLARELGGVIHAVDVYQPFLTRLERRAKELGLADRIKTHCLDIAELPRVFPRVDLLWSEGAAYNIGFANALQTWATAVVPQGFAVVSELCWLRPQPPRAAQEFFAAGYPDMKSVAEITAVAEQAGYRVLSTHLVPPAAWTEGYYDVLGPRATKLFDHADASVRDFARETIREIEVFHESEGSYGYVFFILQRD